MSLDSMIDIESDLALGSAPWSVTVRELATEFEGVTETRVRKIARHLGLAERHQGQPSRHFFGDSMSLAAAGLVRRELRSRGAQVVAEHRGPPDDIVHAVVMVAASSPGRCEKSLRGSVVYDPISPLTVLALGRNQPPRGYTCDGSEACRAACGKICEHAEAAALRKLERGPSLLGGVGSKGGHLDLVHAKVVDGELVAGGGPSCWQCSKAILVDGRIGGVWLFRVSSLSPTWIRYTAAEFHRLTLEACGLPTTPRPNG